MNNLAKRRTPQPLALQFSYDYFACDYSSVFPPFTASGAAVGELVRHRAHMNTPIPPMSMPDSPPIILANPV
jgi:hypothetical protein